MAKSTNLGGVIIILREEESSEEDDNNRTEQNITFGLAVRCLCLPINTMSLINFHNLLPLQRIPDPASAPTYLLPTNNRRT